MIISYNYIIISALYLHGALLLLATSACSMKVRCGNEVRRLPEELLLGAATASFQIEGAWNVSDKSPSIWDTFCHIPGKIEDGTTGDDTCKSYYFYQRDIEMLKFLGVDFYRFSISWPRILPSGFANKISKDGIKYYNNIINSLLANGIEPIITIYHWDLPQSLQDLGGWANPYIADWFEDYARVLFDSFGDRVKNWITLNEPKQFAIFGYGTKFFAPDIYSPGIGDYMAVKNLLLAHARVWHLYDDEYRDKQKGTCSITIEADYATGVTNSREDLEAANLFMEFNVGLFSHPIFSEDGGFPLSVIKRVAERSAEQGFPRSRLPELTDDEIEYIKGTSDFFGFNHYSSRFVTAKTYKSGMYPVPSFEDDIGATTSQLEYSNTAPIPHTTPIPEGMRWSLNWVKDSYNNPPVMITENGYGNFGGSLQDEDRVSYIKKYMNAVLDAMEDGCKVVAYTAWSLMDNFEWSEGLSQKFGLFEVNFNDTNKTRRPKLSAFWYRDVIDTRVLDPKHRAEFRKMTF